MSKRTQKLVSRRRFLRLTGGTSLSLALSACDYAPATTQVPAAASTTPLGTHTPTIPLEPTPRGTPVKPTSPTPGSEPPPLRDLGRARGIQLGAAINGWWFTDSTYKSKYQALIGSEFGLAVVNWGLYWSTVEPARGQFDFAIADRQVAFAQSKNVVVRGHPLVFPTSAYAIADWVVNGGYSRAELIAILRDHITGMVSHYRGQIAEWVVVNEPYLYPQRQKDVFHETIGPEYIEIAFETARAADPSAILIYNDTDNHSESGLTTSLTRKNLEPIRSKELVDAVGLHMHLDGARPPRKEAIMSTMQRYEMPVYVTELDVNLRDVAGTEDERYHIQARIYREVIEACLESRVCESISFWDVGDRYAWGEWPAESEQTTSDADMTLFDDNLDPKPAYYAVRDALVKV